ncbi:MAG: glycosyltransferase, partial [Phycisphaerae bacterium]|nr:glycosyltransferase [Phycisphaerae bacterium]
MWIVILGFCVVTLLLAWLLFGYVVWLRLMGDGRKKGEADLPNTLPRLSVIVPCLNEEAFIAEKYRNLTACEYPRGHLEIVFADGGSTDGTVARLESLSAADPGTRVVACPAAGKISQLNHVLPMLSGDIVVVTDADARLEPEALMWLAADLEADPKMAVVGAFTSPNGGIAVERCYWAAQNRVRVLESRMSHVSTIAACCYAFRRELLNAFPDDVVADDVYVAALANTLGYHSTYSVRARVEELRTPASLPEFFSHKFRKGNAVLREMLRFAYRLPEMPSRWKSILATRIVQH